MILRAQLLRFTDRALAVLLATALLGGVLAFGGRVWWARPFLAVVIAMAVTIWLLRVGLQGRWLWFRSPWTLLGALALALAVAQLGNLGLGTTLPSTHDRPATLRWLLGATGCLALFVVVAGYADRLGHTLVIWGSVVAAFAINTMFALVQWVSGAEGLYGSIQPGQGPSWGPSLADLLAAPGSSTLRLVAEPTAHGAGWAISQPDRPFLFGSLMGGPGAYLALGALALPLGLGLTLQVLAPRGDRAGLWNRLRESGQTGLVAFLLVMTLAGSALVGLVAGPLLALPFALGMILAGLPTAWRTGLGRTALVLTTAAVLALGAGVATGDLLGRPRGVSPLAGRATWGESVRVWSESARIVRDSPLWGTGLGSFATVHPHYKTLDPSPTTAGSSLAQWGVEAGGIGMGLLAVGGLWLLARLPVALRRVGSADRALAFALLGTLVCFALVSALHWTIELPALALSATAVLGTAHRWLAGGTDLFVEAA